MKDSEDLKAVIQTYEYCGYMINPHSADILAEFIEDYGVHWTQEAIKTADRYGHKNLQYARAILEDWKSKGGMANADRQRHNKLGQSVKKSDAENILASIGVKPL